MILRSLVVGALLASSAFAGARAAEPSITDQLMAVDNAFAAYSREHGAAEAFRAFMDPKDSREFGGGDPVRGAEAIYQAQGGDKPAAAKLTWTASEAFASKAGDMGVTWGRWIDTPNDPSKKPITGRYVTVWRKDAEGHWKGLIDIGNPD